MAFKSAKRGKIVEINASKCPPDTKYEACWIEVARLCAKYRVPLVLSSDAHFAPDVGNVGNAINVIQRAEVPEELVLNADAARFAKKLSEMTGKLTPYNEKSTQRGIYYKADFIY